MKLIVLIDDSAFHRRVAGYELSTRSGIVIPEQVQTVDDIDGADVGLLILDRHMIRSWRQATERLVSRIGPECEIVEWTAGTKFDDRERWHNSIMAISKIGPMGMLAKVVNRWIATGTVRDEKESAV